MTPGIYVQRRRERRGRMLSEVAAQLELDLIANGVEETLRLTYQIETYLRLVEHDILFASRGMAAALAQQSSLEFEPKIYFDLITYCANPLQIEAPRVCRSCGSAHPLPDSHLCEVCDGWGSTKMGLAKRLDEQPLRLAS